MLDIGSSSVEPPFDVQFHLLPCAKPAAEGGEYIADQSLAGCLINTKGFLMHECSKAGGDQPIRSMQARPARASFAGAPALPISAHKGPGSDSVRSHC